MKNSRKMKPTLTQKEHPKIDPCQDISNIIDDADIPEKLPTTREEYKKQIAKVVVRHQAFSGPIPPPSFLKEYEEILPNAADRILTMAEKQGEHRRFMEKTWLKLSNREVHFGQILGFLIGVIAIVAGAYTAINGAGISGGLLGTSGVVGLVTVFVVGSKQNKKNK